MEHKIHGLRVFLLCTLSLIEKEPSIPCSKIEQLLLEGIATALSKDYPDTFRDFLSSDAITAIDDYYKKWVGCAEGVELRKYLCGENAGLQLLIALALNEIY